MSAMTTRINDLPVYESREDSLEARHYNLWRRARMRFGDSMRMELPGLIGMELILDKHEWVVVDARQNDLPVLAWVEFADHGRSALHEPVPCKLNYYHFAATSLRAKVLVILEKTLEDWLHETGSHKHQET